jgi:transposase-like protein
MRAPTPEGDAYLEAAREAAATLGAPNSDREKLARRVAAINAKSPGLPAEVRQFFSKISDRYGREIASLLFKWVIQLHPVTESGPPKKRKGAHNAARDNRLLDELAATSHCSKRVFAERLVDTDAKRKRWGFQSAEGVLRRLKYLKAQQRTK